VECALTNQEFSWHDYTIKELKDATANLWYVSSQTKNSTDTIKELKDATANLWYVYSQTKNSADTITRLKN
jgi:uncharacterized coiled-coil protein SlyX